MRAQKMVAVSASVSAVSGADADDRRRAKAWKCREAVIDRFTIDLKMETEAIRGRTRIAGVRTSPKIRRGMSVSRRF